MSSLVVTLCQWNSVGSIFCISYIRAERADRAILHLGSQPMLQVCCVPVQLITDCLGGLHFFVVVVNK